jgi:hypothetical protein
MAMKPIWRHEFVPVSAILLALSFVGYGSLLRNDRVPFSAHSDIVAMHLGTKTVLWDSLQRGDGLPFWRGDQFSGLPAFTNPESQYTYPLHALFYLLPPAQAVGPTIWLQLLAGSLVLFWVGRVLGLGRVACLFMAVAQLFNFKLIAITYAGFLPILPIATLFPLLFAAVFRLTERPGLRATLVLTACGALCLSTGGFQLLYYALIFLAAFLLWKLVGWWRGDEREHARRVALCASAAGVLSLGVMAYLLIPMLAEASLLSRAAATYDFFLSGYSLTPDHLRNFLNPESFGRLFDASKVDAYLWEEVVYFGIIPLVLAVIGARRGWRRPFVPFLVIAFAGSLMLATKTPLTRTLYEFLPGFGLFRMPIRFVYFTGFFGICLAGVGLEELTVLLREERIPARLSAIARALPAMLLILVGVEGVFYSHRYVNTEPAAVVLPQTAVAGFFDRDETIFRVAPLYRHAIQPGWAAPMRLELATGYLPYNLRHYRAYLELLRFGEVTNESFYSWADLGDVTRWDLLELLNVKYVVSRTPVERLEWSGFRHVAQLESQPLFVFFEGLRESDLHVYRNRRFVERAFWSPSVEGVRTEAEMIRLMGERDLRRTTLVYGEARSEIDGTEDSVTVVESSGGHLVLESHSARRRFLTISEIRHPGWRASIDGNDLSLEPCNLALMGAWVPPGDHEIVLEFRPLYWLPSVALSATSVAVVIAILVVGVIRRRSQPSAWS